MRESRTFPSDLARVRVLGADQKKSGLLGFSQLDNAQRRLWHTNPRLLSLLPLNKFSLPSLPKIHETSILVPIALFASLSRLGPWHEKQRALGT